MSVVMKKHFYGVDYVRMEEWLDKQGQKGLRLTGIQGSRYEFDQTDQVYYYRLAFVDATLNPSDRETALNRLRMKKMIYSCQKGPWAYFYSQSPIQVKRSAEENLALLGAFRRHIGFILFLLGSQVIFYLLQAENLWTWKVGLYLILHICLLILFIRLTLWQPGLLPFYRHYQSLKYVSNLD